MIQKTDSSHIASLLTDYYGLPLVGNTGLDESGHEYLELYPDGVHRNDGFCVRLSLGWRRMKGEFMPGAFAAPMIREMGNAPDENKAIFTGLIQKILAEKGNVTMMVNAQEVEPGNTKSWPKVWDRLSISFEKSPLAVNTEDIQDTEKALLHWGGRFLAGILALAPLEELETTEDVNPEGLPEGAKTLVEVNRYERNRFNRAACIEIHGDSCKACGFNFGNSYGDLGKGFIHVHHVTPVSKIGENYQINPVTDLLPLCPNCHAMVHRRDPPLDIQELIEILQSVL